MGRRQGPVDLLRRLGNRPDARLQGYSTAGFIPFDIEHPAALAFTERFFDIAMKEVAGHPALNSIWLANEPTYYSISPLSAALFREEAIGLSLKRKAIRTLEGAVNG